MIEVGIRAEGLAMLYGPYPDETDGSLQAQYAPRDPVAEFLRGDITMRALRVLVRVLPLDSALVRAVRGHSWTTTDYLLHAVDSDLRWSRAERIAIATERAPRAPKLLPLPDEELTLEDAVEQEQLEQQERELSALAAAIEPREIEN